MVLRRVRERMGRRRLYLRLTQTLRAIAAAQAFGLLSTRRTCLAAARPALARKIAEAACDDVWGRVWLFYR